MMNLILEQVYIISMLNSLITGLSLVLEMVTTLLKALFQVKMISIRSLLLD